MHDHLESDTPPAPRDHTMHGHVPFVEGISAATLYGYVRKTPGGAVYREAGSLAVVSGAQHQPTCSCRYCTPRTEESR